MAIIESNDLVKVNQRKYPISWQLSDFLVKVNFEELKNYACTTINWNPKLQSTIHAICSYKQWSYKQD